MVHRDQTSSIVERHQTTATYTTISPAQFSEDETAEGFALPRDIPCCLESHALAFLFTASELIPARDGQTSHGHLDFLRQLYQIVTPNSALSLATSWLAVVVIGLHEKGGTYPLERQLVTKLIKSIMAAVSDPTTVLKDETLMAVVLVAFGEHLRWCAKNIHNTPRDFFDRSLRTSTIHQSGAESLVRQRGHLNFQNNISLALYDATRHNAIGFAFYAGKMGRNWDLWNVDGDVRQKCDSYTPATELDSCALKIVGLRYKVKIRDFSPESGTRESLLQVFEQLRSSQYRVPTSWLHPLTTFSTQNSRPSHVSFLISQWHLLQLAVMLLLKELNIRTGVFDIPSTQDILEAECISYVINCGNSILGVNENESEAKVSSSGLAVFPCVRLEQAMRSPTGSRRFGQTLRGFDLILSSALQDLDISADVILRYQEVLLWARGEQSTIRQAHVLLSNKFAD